MITLEVFVEEPSAEAALEIILPKMLDDNVNYSIHPHQGKPDLFKNVRSRLAGLRHSELQNMRILVLYDNDDHPDCKQKKDELSKVIADVGLIVPSQDNEEIVRPNALVRVVMQELESWFLGDADAIRKAFPRVDRTFEKKEKYRKPDGIRGGASETLHSLLQKSGYYKNKFPKIEVARRISQHMDPTKNRSKSFQVFKSGVEILCA